MRLPGLYLADECSDSESQEEGQPRTTTRSAEQSRDTSWLPGLPSIFDEQRQRYPMPFPLPGLDYASEEHEHSEGLTAAQLPTQITATGGAEGVEQQRVTLQTPGREAPRRENYMAVPPAVVTGGLQTTEPAFDDSDFDYYADETDTQKDPDSVEKEVDHLGVKDTSTNDSEPSVKGPEPTTTQYRSANHKPVQLPQTIPLSPQPPPNYAPPLSYLTSGGVTHPPYPQTTSPPPFNDPWLFPNRIPPAGAYINPVFFMSRLPRPHAAPVYTTLEDFKQAHPMTGRKQGESNRPPMLLAASSPMVNNSNHNTLDSHPSQDQREANIPDGSRKPGFLPLNHDKSRDIQPTRSASHTPRRRSCSPLKESELENRGRVSSAAANSRRQRSPLRSHANNAAGEDMTRTDLGNVTVPLAVVGSSSLPTIPQITAQPWTAAPEPALPPAPDRTSPSAGRKTKKRRRGNQRQRKKNRGNPEEEEDSASEESESSAISTKSTISTLTDKRGSMRRSKGRERPRAWDFF